MYLTFNAKVLSLELQIELNIANERITLKNTFTELNQ